jgi:hypothetical protein
LTIAVIFFGGAMMFPSETSFQLLAISSQLVLVVANFGVALKRLLATRGG